MLGSESRNFLTAILGLGTVIAAFGLVAGCGSSSGSHSHTVVAGHPQAVLAKYRAAPASGGSPASSNCGPSSASTLASTSAARIYATKGEVFGCSKANKRSFRLGDQKCSRAGGIAPVALMGSIVAFGLDICGTNNCSSRVYAQQLTNGKVLSSFPAYVGPGGTGVTPTSVNSVVVTTGGAVAWIATGCSISPGSHQFQVRAGSKLLDSGVGISPGSLRLHGSTITWLDAHKTRSASLH